METNLLHYYLGLIEKHEYGYPLHNILNTMKISRRNNICSEVFKNIDFGNYRLNDIRFSLDGDHPTKFVDSKINEINMLNGHNSKVTNIMISDDKKYVTTYSEEGTLIVCDVIMRESIYKFDLDGCKIRSYYYSDDSKYLFGNDNQDNVLMWNLMNGKRILKINKKVFHYINEMKRIIFSRSDFSVYKSELYLSRSDNEETETVEKLLKNHISHLEKISFIKVSGDRKNIAVGFENGSVYWLDNSENGEVCMLLGPARKISVSSLSDDKKMMVSVSEYNNSLMVWNLESLTLNCTKFSDFRNIKTIVLSDNKKIIVTYNENNTIQIFYNDNKKIRLISTIKSDEPVSCMTVSSDNKYLFAGSYSGRMYLWEIKDEEKTAKVYKGSCNKEIESIAVSMDNKFAAVSFSHNPTEVWNLLLDKSDKLAEWGFVDKYAHTELMMLPEWCGSDITRLVMVSPDKTVKIWDVNNIEPKYELTKCDPYKESMSFILSPDKKYIGISGFSQIKIYDLINETFDKYEEYPKKINGRLITAAFSDDNKYIACSMSCSGEKCIIVSEIGTSSVWRIDTKFMAEGIAFSYDNKSVFLCSEKGDVELWNIRKGKRIQSMYNTSDIHIMNCQFYNTNWSDEVKNVIIQNGGIVL